jgi:hypothetical protein
LISKNKNALLQQRIDPLVKIFLLSREVLLEDSHAFSIHTKRFLYGHLVNQIGQEFALPTTKSGHTKNQMRSACN